MDKCNRMSMDLSRLAHYDYLDEHGKLVELPCAIGDDIYVICTCEQIQPRLDGTLYDSCGGPGTATGYYCPYEDSCPYDTDDCKSCEGKEAVFKDTASRFFVSEAGIEIIPENCSVCSTLGSTVFLTQEDAEKALEGGEKSVETGESIW